VPFLLYNFKLTDLRDLFSFSVDKYHEKLTKKTTLKLWFHPNGTKSYDVAITSYFAKIQHYNVAKAPKFVTTNFLVM